MHCTAPHRCRMLKDAEACPGTSGSSSAWTFAIGQTRCRPGLSQSPTHDFIASSRSVVLAPYAERAASSHQLHLHPSLLLQNELSLLCIYSRHEQRCLDMALIIPFAFRSSHGSHLLTVTRHEHCSDVCCLLLDVNHVSPYLHLASCES